MVWLLLPGVLLLLWLLFRKPRPTAYEVASRERDVRLENEALAKHRYDDRSVDGMRDYYVHSIDFDFPTMTALEELVSRYGGPTEYCDVSVRRTPGLNYGARTAQFCGKSESIWSAGVESRRVRTSVRYASGSTSLATQVATTV